MDLVSRVQQIILKPKEEWIKIKEEEISIQQLFISYAAILAAIPAVAQFLGLAIIGGSKIPYIGRSIFLRTFSFCIFYYIVSLVIVYLLGFIINALAPTFSSKQNQINAMKIAVYSMTPAWVAGVLYIIPFLGILVFLASIYSIYLLYLGFDAPLMDTPKEKVGGYLVVSVIVVIVLMAVIWIILGAILTVGAYRAI